MQVNVAVPLMPCPPIVSWYLAVLPAATVAELDPPVPMPKPKVGLVPVPDSATVCGLLDALSVMLRVAVSEPAAEGVNEIAILQFAPAATPFPQALVSPNSLLSEPVTWILLIDKAAFPVLVRVTVWDVLVTPTT